MLRFPASPRASVAALLTALLIALLAPLALWCPLALAADAPALSRGAYLAVAGDCAACHTAGPKAAAFTGGLAMNSPFGVIYSSNITPDPETGIGRYSLRDFDQAVRHGVRRDGKRLYPAMPFPSFAGLSDADVADLYRYFQTEVKPVSFRPRPTDLPFPFDQRWAMFFWDAAFVKHAPFEARSDQSVAWNRGAYLVRTLGHCGACHTPHGPAYQERGYDESAPLFLTGATLDHWYAADLSGNRAAGLGRLSEQDIVTTLRTGHTEKSAVFGSMVDVITVSTQHLTDADLAAIAVYLKSLPARGEAASYRPGAAPSAAVRPASLKERPGAGIYSGFCQKCHAADGDGKADKYPALAGNQAVLAADPVGLIRLVLQGGSSPATGQESPAGKMPAFDRQLSDADIADVLTYLRSEWGNGAGAVAPGTVGRLRGTLQKEAVKAATKP
jgi:mono/diheme cytochrome c family protein